MPNATERHRARVFLVEDHALVRENLIELIQAEADLVVCGEAEDVPTALALIRHHEPGLVILDLSLKGSNGFDLLKDLKELQPKPAVLVLSMHEETFYALQALEAGARGYITKEDATTNLLVAIRRVLSGQRYLTDRFIGPRVGKFADAGQAIAEEVRA
jgi:DNA-binding NarL/FixJ family response regulator